MEKEEIEGDEPCLIRRLPEKSSDSESRWFEGMILRLFLVVMVALVLVLLWRVRFCCCC